MRDRLPRVSQPKQSQKGDQHDLSERWKAVNQEGETAASNGRFNQIQDSHTTAFRSAAGEV